MAELSYTTRHPEARRHRTERQHYTEQSGGAQHHITRPGGKTAPNATRRHNGSGRNPAAQQDVARPSGESTLDTARRRSASWHGSAAWPHFTELGGSAKQDKAAIPYTANPDQAARHSSAAPYLEATPCPKTRSGVSSEHETNRFTGPHAPLGSLFSPGPEPNTLRLPDNRHAHRNAPREHFVSQQGPRGPLHRLATHLQHRQCHRSFNQPARND